MAGELNDALNAIGNLGKALKSTTQQYRESSEDLRKTYANTKGGDAKREYLVQEAQVKNTKKNVEALDDLYKAIITLEAETNSNKGATEQATRSLKWMAKNVKALNIEGLDSGFDSMVEGMVDGTKKTSSKLNQYRKVIEETNNTQTKKHREDVKLLENTRKIRLKYEALKDSMTANIKSYFSLEAGIANVITGLKRSFNELELAQQHQIGMYGGMADGLNSVAYSMSLAPEEMQKFVATNKAMILSSVKTYGTLNDAVSRSVSILSTSNDQGQTLQNEAYKLTGDYGKASVLLGNTMTMLKKSGDNLSFDELKNQTFDLLKQFKGLAQISSLSSEQIQGLTSNFLESDAVRQKMNSLQSNKERQQFIKDTIASAERNRILGFSVEQTFKIAEAMTSLSQTKTKDRIKQTAVTAQLAQTLGLGDEANTITKLGRKKYRTTEEKDELQKALDKVGRAAAKRSGEKGPQGEAFNLYLEKVLDNMGKFGELMKLSNSTTAQGNALSDAQVKSAQSQESNLEGLPAIMQSIKNVWDEYATPFFKDSTVQILGGLAGMGVDILMGFGPILAGFLAGGGTIATILGGVATGIGAVVTVLTGPIGIAIAAIAAAVALWSYFSDNRTKAEKQQDEKQQRTNDFLDSIKGLSKEQRDLKLAEFSESEAVIERIQEQQSGHAALAAAALKELESNQINTGRGKKPKKNQEPTVYSPQAKKTPTTEKSALSKSADKVSPISNDGRTPEERKKYIRQRKVGMKIKNKISRLKSDVPEGAIKETGAVLGLPNRKPAHEQTSDELKITNELMRNQLILLTAMVENSEDTKKGIGKIDKSVNKVGKDQTDATNTQTESMSDNNRMDRTRRQFVAG